MVVLVAVVSEPVFASDDRLVFSSFKGSPVQKVGQVILNHAYNKLNLKVTYQSAPAKRSLLMSSRGELDGETARTWELGITHPTLLRVPTPLFKFEGVAYRLNGPPINKVEQLEPNLRVGIQRGVTWAENIVALRKGVVRVDSVTELAQKILNKSIDVALYTGIGFQEEIERYEQNERIVKGQPLFDKALYHYLHKKNESLVDPVNAVLSEMMKTGELEKLFIEARNK